MEFPEELCGVHHGQTAYIVGKGPSLAHLRREHFNYGVVLAINHSLVKVQSLGLSNKIYSMQKDGLEMVKPMASTVLLLQHGYSDAFMPEHPRRFIMHSDPSEMSIITAIRLALWMGCAYFKLLCFDSLVTGDIRTYNPETEQAVITEGGANYERNKAAILAEVKKVNSVFVTP